MYIIAIIIGYLLGMLSPAALLSRMKKIDLKAFGSGNLGATNTMMALGKGYGALVMLFDIGKSFLSVKLSQYLFPALPYIGITAGASAVVGHIYPFYMHFKGGKGLAAYGGMLLALRPWMCPIILVLSIAIMLISNHGVAMAISVCILSPIMFFILTGDIGAFLLLTGVSVLIILNHKQNFREASQNQHIKVRDYIKNHLFR